MSLSGLPLRDAVSLYIEKRYALRQGDLVTLIRLKRDYPFLFDDETEQALHPIFLYLDSIRTNPVYRAQLEILYQKHLKYQQVLAVIKDIPFCE